MAAWRGKTLFFLFLPFCLFRSLLPYVSLSLYFLLSILSHCPSLPLSLPLVSGICLWPVVCSVKITIKQGGRVAGGHKLAFIMLSKTTALRTAHCCLFGTAVNLSSTHMHTNTQFLPVRESHFFQSKLCRFFWK